MTFIAGFALGVLATIGFSFLAVASQQTTLDEDHFKD